MEKVEKWLTTLYAYGESQLSRSLWDTESDLIKQLPLDLEIKSSEIDEQNIYRMRKYKTHFFDPNKKKVYDQVVKTTKQKGIALWKPVWEYLIKQVPDAYTFSGDCLFTEFVPIDVVYNKSLDFTYEPYVATSVVNSSKIFRSLLEEERDKKLDKLQKNLQYTMIGALFSFMISFFLSRWFGLLAFSLTSIIVFLIFRQKGNIVKKFSFLSKREVLKNLFPDNKTIKSIILDDTITVRVNLFNNEQQGVKMFNTLTKENPREQSKESIFTPSYVQNIDSISLSIKNQDERRFNQRVKKSKKNDPIMYFEKDEVVIIPVQGLENHPVMEYIIENIKIEDLNIPCIIEKYLEKSLQLESLED